MLCPVHALGKFYVYGAVCAGSPFPWLSGSDAGDYFASLLSSVVGFFGLCPCLGVNSMYAFPALGSHVQIQYATFRCYGLVPYP